MTPDNAPAPKGRGLLRAFVAFFVAFDAAVFFQWADGALQSEFGGHRDEAAHFLAGVRVRERITHLRDHASSVAADVSREELAAGSRSPVFSLALGGWMAAFGASRTAVLLFMAMLAAATTVLIFCAVRRALGDLPAAAAALAWICAPAVRESYSTVLPEQLYALAAALLLWAQSASQRKPHNAVPQSCAETQQPAGLPGDSCRPAARAHSLIRLVSLLVIAGVLALACTVAFALAPGDTRAALRFLKDCVLTSGTAVAAFALAGIAMSPRAGAGESIAWPAAAALAAGVLVARWLKAGDADTRVLVVAMPALAMLAVRGAFAFAGAIGSRAAIAREFPRRRALWLLLLLLLALPGDLLGRRRKEWSGFGPVADALIAESRGAARVLVVSDPRGEEMLLSELAMRGARQITVERGSETLTDASGSAPRRKALERFLEDEQLFAHLIAGRIRYIVLDSAVPQEVRAGYHDQMRRIIEGNVRSFWPVFESPVVRDGEQQGHPLRIYRVMQSEGVEFQLR